MPDAGPSISERGHYFDSKMKTLDIEYQVRWKMQSG